MSQHEYHRLIRSLAPYAAMADLVDLLVAELAKRRKGPFRFRGNPPFGRYRSLRPGPETPMWNALRKQLRPFLNRYGDQVALARQLGLPRQRVNAWITGYNQLPDGERMLQLIAWLLASRRGRRPV